MPVSTLYLPAPDTEHPFQACACHRQMVVLCSDRHEVVERFVNNRLAALTSSAGALSVSVRHNASDSPPDYGLAVHPASINRVLGSEFDLIRYDAHLAFNADVLAALTGTLRGGGLLILIVPPAWLNAHQSVPGVFLNRWRRMLLEATVAAGDGLTGTLPCRQLLNGPTLSSEPQSPGVVCTETSALSDQQQVVAELIEHAHGPDQVLLLQAERGRGKSAALGLASAMLLAQSPDKNICVSAPSRRAAEVVFRHLAESSGRVSFVAPDALHQIPPDTLLLIDEAACIPLPVLGYACQRFDHLILATTTTGYEGAGRGFALRFRALLQSKGIRYRESALTVPIRWADGDPLEKFCNKALLLDAELPLLNSNTGKIPTRSPIAVDTRVTGSLGIQTGSQLVEDEPRLRDLFGLLIQAHYRTRPADLQRLLDDPMVRVFGWYEDDTLLAAAWISLEGPIIDLPLRQQILRRARRPAGHILPQLLAQFTLQARALDLRYARIVRIAVHPALQRRGIGSHLLREVHRHFTEHGYDAVGAMFSASPEACAFWHRNTYTLCHLGQRAQASSGYQALTVIHPLGDAAKTLAHRASLLFHDRCRFHALKPLLRYCADPDGTESAVSLTDAGLLDPFIIDDFCSGRRTWLDSHCAIARTARRWLSCTSLRSDMDSNTIHALKLCTDNGTTPASLAKALNLPGKAAAHRYLQELLRNPTQPAAAC